MIRIHSANQIVAWLWVACILQLLQGTPLIVFAVAALWLALICCPRRCWQTLKRCRYLLMALTLVYGWATPGQYLWPHPYSPTVEGLEFGAWQTLRLCGVLASLQLLLWRLSPAQIFSGLYLLMRPLSGLGFDRQRWALRLSLTMQFAAETLSQDKPLSRDGFLEQLTAAGQTDTLQEVSILVESQSFFDLLLLCALGAAAGATLLMLL